MRIAQLLKSTEYGSKVTVKGWVRTKRGNKNVAFLALKPSLSKIRALIPLILTSSPFPIRQESSGAYVTSRAAAILHSCPCSLRVSYIPFTMRGGPPTLKNEFICKTFMSFYLFLFFFSFPNFAKPWSV